eukprot:6185279-Prorocentrum_lima.AAC.1
MSRGCSNFPFRTTGQSVSPCLFPRAFCDLFWLQRHFLRLALRLWAPPWAASAVGCDAARLGW